jgi:AcrR family transcriptional regulator
MAFKSRGCDSIWAMKETNSPRVLRKRAERRERIVEAAFAAIAESGPAEFSLNQLARDLDYTPGALYWYFASKELLVLEVQKRAFTELAQKAAVARVGWQARGAQAKLEPVARLLHALLSLARFYLELGRTEPQYARLIAFSLDPRVWLDDSAAAELGPVLGAVFNEVATPFAEAQHGGALSAGDGAQRAVQYWAALQGALQIGKLERISPALFNGEAVGLDTARTLLLGWGADPDALARASASSQA